MVFDVAKNEFARLSLTTSGDASMLHLKVHSIVADSKGNLYTTETYEGKRVQKFVYRGLRKVPRGDQGTPWGDR